MRKSIDRKLIAYIQEQGSNNVLIDVVVASKNGLSYLYKGSTWKRDILFRKSGYCIDREGRKCRIEVLNRWYTPSWAEVDNIEITDEAKNRYQKWISGEFRRMPSEQ
ncbi:hypothetical protein [Microbulbifer sp.]|uniref:hypothetical protein n=1 Tax=Microbulbifer sp. TaxID=1908541 RepID=UPI00258B9B7F|nr:hypothetical protein [Microbulbifer sp.]